MGNVMVGPKCCVTIQLSRIHRILARGSGKGVQENPVFRAGSTLSKFRGEVEPATVEIKLPYYFAYNTLRSGKRQDQVPLTNDYGEPLPQIMLLVAIRTLKSIDWISAISFWQSVRTDLIEGVEDAAAKGLNILKDEIEILLPAPPSEVKTTIKDSIIRLEEWAKEWIFMMVRSGHIHYLDAWDKAARRALERLRIVGENFEFIDGLEESGGCEVDEMSRVLRAIKRATLIG